MVTSEIHHLRVLDHRVVVSLAILSSPDTNLLVIHLNRDIPLIDLERCIIIARPIWERDRHSVAHSSDSQIDHVLSATLIGEIARLQLRELLRGNVTLQHVLVPQHCVALLSEYLLRDWLGCVLLLLYLLL